MQRAEVTVSFPDVDGLLIAGKGKWNERADKAFPSPFILGKMKASPKAYAPFLGFRHTSVMTPTFWVVYNIIKYRNGEELPDSVIASRVTHMCHFGAAD